MNNYTIEDLLKEGLSATDKDGGLHVVSMIEDGYVSASNNPKLTSLSLPKHTTGDVYASNNPKLSKWLNENYGNTPYKIYFSGVLKSGVAMFDNIETKVLSKRVVGGLTVYETTSDDLKYVVFDGTNYSHGETIRDAKNDLMYKIGNRDTTKYNHWKKSSGKIKIKELVQGYRVITGACEAGVKQFLSSLKDVKQSYTLKEVLSMTTGHYGNEALKNFLTK